MASSNETPADLPPPPSDGVNCALTLATGQALALIATLIQRGGLYSAQEFGEVLSSLARTQPDSDEKRILDLWSLMIRDSGKAVDGFEASLRHNPPG